MAELSTQAQGTTNTDGAETKSAMSPATLTTVGGTVAKVEDGVAVEKTPADLRNDDLTYVDKAIANALSLGKKLHVIASGEMPDADADVATDDELEAAGILANHAFPTEFAPMIVAFAKAAHDKQTEGLSVNYIGPMRLSIAYAIRDLETKQ